MKEIDHYRRSELYTDTYGIEDQIAEGDKIATRWTSLDTNTGSLFGMPATGKSTTIMGITIDRMTDGKIVESWDELDQLGMLQQLGFIPHRDCRKRDYSRPFHREIQFAALYARA